MYDQTSGPTSGQWTVCERTTDRSGWNHQIASFFDYWLTISPSGRLPGRQHFDPLDIPKLMARVWMLDIVPGFNGPRFRYRLAGTKEVETLEREVTGRFLDEAHPHLRESREGFSRFIFMAERGAATYRKGRVLFSHRREHQTVENCMVPLARDGTSVDMIAVCSMLYRWDGSEN